MTNHADAEFHKDCPIVWSVVDKDKNDLLNWQKYAVYLDTKNNDKVTVDNAYYIGGNIDFYVKALTAFNNPVYRLIRITEDLTGKNCM